MPTDPAQLGFLAVLFGAYFVGTVLGFGTTVLAVTFGAQLIEIDVLLPVVAPLNVGLGAYIALRHRKTTEWPILLKRVLPLVVLGLPLGLALFNLRAVGWLRLGFGLFVTLLAVLQLLGSRVSAPQAKPLGKVPSAVLLVASGIVHGLWATPGPLIVYVVGREITDKAAFRSTVATLFLPLTSALVVDYALTGLYHDEVIRLTLWAVPAVLLGIVLGERAYAKLRPELFRRGVWLLLLVGGIVLSARAAFE
jgi:hypothetical protein